MFVLGFCFGYFFFFEGSFDPLFTGGTSGVIFIERFLLLQFLQFRVEGEEMIEINGREIKTSRVICDELELTLNLSAQDNFQPIKIHKVNGKTEFTMILIEFLG